MTTCPSGCCDAAGNCRTGNENTACGDGGQLCVDCLAQNEQCSAQGFCFDGVHCGPENCAGCCTATGECRPGSSSTECGSFGNLCENCGALGETCQGGTCSDGNDCPGSYAGCSPDALTAPPFTSSSCTEEELEEIEFACDDTDDEACSDAIGDIRFDNPLCFDCLIQFTNEQATTKCAVPFLSPECNHDLTCATDCANAACRGCPDPRQQDCGETVFEFDGECREWINGVFCLDAARQGPAAFCNFQNYNTTGEWLASIGDFYCGG